MTEIAVGPEITFRIASATDNNALARIHSASWMAGFNSLLDSDLMRRAVSMRCSPDRWTTLLNDGSTTILASAASQDIALLQFSIDSKTEAEIKRVYVMPEHWGDGTAHQLMEHALELLSSARITRVQVWSAETPQARRFYEKVGFRATGRTLQSEVIEGSNVISNDYEYILHLTAN